MRRFKKLMNITTLKVQFFKRRRILLALKKQNEQYRLYHALHEHAPILQQPEPNDFFHAIVSRQPVLHQTGLLL